MDLKLCAACGAKSPDVGDAFCPECYHRFDEPVKSRASTLAGDESPAGGFTGSQRLVLALFGIHGLVCNGIGFVIIAVVFALAYLVAIVVGDVSDGMLLTVGGPLASALDIGYRVRFAGGE